MAFQISTQSSKMAMLSCVPWARNQLSGKQFPVEAAILDRFEDVLGLDRLAGIQIRDRARDLEDAVVGARGKIHRFHRVFQILRAGVVKLAMLAHQLRRHRGVGVHAFVFIEALRLNRSRRRDPLADGSRFFTQFGGRKFLEIDQGDFHMNVDPIK